MLQWLLIALAQWKVGSTSENLLNEISENLLNEIRQITDSFCRAKVIKKVYNNIIKIQ